MARTQQRRNQAIGSTLLLAGYKTCFAWRFMRSFLGCWLANASGRDPSRQYRAWLAGLKILGATLPNRSGGAQRGTHLCRGRAWLRWCRHTGPKIDAADNVNDGVEVNSLLHGREDEASSDAVYQGADQRQNGSRVPWQRGKHPFGRPCPTPIKLQGAAISVAALRRASLAVKFQ